MILQLSPLPEIPRRKDCTARKTNVARYRLSLGLLLCAVSFLVEAEETVNDVTQLNPITVDRVVHPTSIEEVQKSIRGSEGPISIGGARFSHGGQTAEENALFVDMTQLNNIVALDVAAKTVTVEAGITWRKLQEALDPKGLSVKIMQSYANFTVGGALSVNCHGRYVGSGPIISSVRQLKLVLADGQTVIASPQENADLFYGVIGGYGGLGIIVEATLDLVENERILRKVVSMDLEEYPAWFNKTIRNAEGAVLHNASLYPPRYGRIRAVTWSKTSEPLTIQDRLMPFDGPDFGDHLKILLLSELPFGKRIRQHVFDPFTLRHEAVEWRNYEASADAAVLEPFSRKHSTYALQEYFVPLESFLPFAEKLREVLQHHGVNMLNVSIRHASADPGSLLAWAPEESFAFVLYYKQGISAAAQEKVGIWTRELINAVLSEGGRYYLPYQLHATPEQFRKAYPRYMEYIALKNRVDPQRKFRSKFLDKYL